MPGVSCSVAICKNNFYKKKKSADADQQIAFFTFPKNKKLEKIWIMRCRRKDEIKTKTARVCSNHFKKDDFVDDLYARVMGTRPKLKLKDGAIPSENLKYLGDVSKQTTARSGKRVAMKTQKAIVEDPLEVHSPVSDVSSTSIESDEDILQRKYEDLLKENKRLKQKLEENEQELCTTRTKILELNKISNKKILIVNKRRKIILHVGL
ncbi:uncharacterized protein LOC114333628 isoform X4 [Diabrotica virgifera virgifera]|uniref:Uncharacterized protein LOC114333628 isoform X3 n=1 Tax=Diabrotica virgifera virgifera TaxID=50390 RepID=A0A6P7FX27_DIAVI|nr:uncharacterized protein LOC114333628 isoform X4 [Diabrotica virgifera virgifera]XP_028139358.1 uncharacterized protein LOC114333628 isoform X4 [Diabrotica virgifera virgifera]